MILYRYLDFFGGLKTLEQGSFKATRPIDYNDPFEYLITSEVDRRTFRKEFLAKISPSDLVEWVSQQLEKEGIQDPTSKEKRKAELTIRNQLRERYEAAFQRGVEERTHHRLELLSKSMAVICFSDNSNNNLMWSHYCHGHRGVILEFDTIAGFSSEPTIIKIKYEQKPPSVNFLNGNFSHVTKEMQAHLQRKTLGYKSEIWEYEGEHRIQFNMSVLKCAEDDRGKEILTFEVPKNSIKSITFGYRLTEGQVSQLCEVLDDEGYDHVTRKYAIPSIKDYSLKYVDRGLWETRQAERERIREEYIRNPL